MALQLITRVLDCASGHMGLLTLGCSYERGPALSKQAERHPSIIVIAVVVFLTTSVRGEDVVLPCPEGLLDSTTAITNGLSDTRDGGTVHLGPCTYYLTRAVEARWNHHGAIKGKGRELTFIKILPGAKIDGVPMAAWAEDIGFTPSWSTLFLFENPESGDITISDLSIVVTDPEPAGLQDSIPDDDDWWKGSLYNMIVVTGPRVDTHFERSSFRGAAGNFFGFNVAHVNHVFNFPPTKGNHTVRDCNFESVGVTVNPSQFIGGVITVTDNTFKNTFYGPVIEDCSDCNVRISGNSISEVQSAGIILVRTGKVSLEPSTYLIEHNSIYASDIPADKGIVVTDDFEGSEIKIQDNEIDLTENTSQ